MRAKWIHRLWIIFTLTLKSAALDHIDNPKCLIAVVIFIGKICKSNSKSSELAIGGTITKNFQG